MEGFEDTEYTKVVGYISTFTAEEYFRSPVRVDGCFSDSFWIQIDFYHSLVLSHLLFIKVLETLSKEMTSRCPVKLLYVGDLTLLSESREVLKGKLESRKEVVVSKGLRVNVKKMKMMIVSEKDRNVRKEGKFLFAVYRKGGSRNSLRVLEVDEMIMKLNPCFTQGGKQT